MSADVTHDPRTDWCACEPEGIDRCGYRMLADVVIEKLNPQDSDDAEVSLCMDAVSRIAAFVESLICSCASIEYGDPCPRCAVLGQYRMKPVQR